MHNDIFPRNKFALNIKTRKIRIIFTSRFTGNCDVCKKDGVILAGTPTEASANIYISDEDYDIVADNPFWVAPDFEIACNNGYSHSAKGLSPTHRYVISTEKNKKGYKEEGTHFEEVLSRFVPNFVKVIKEKQLLLEKENGKKSV